jgi:hypothetical protein
MMDAAHAEGGRPQVCYIQHCWAIFINGFNG